MKWKSTIIVKGKRRQVTILAFKILNDFVCEILKFILFKFAHSALNATDPRNIWKQFIAEAMSNDEIFENFFIC
uniref:Uncharacterized protein n=1 Tax=Wuchereria bancrofti TaxID=6293 RepID=A0A1I8ELV2_WUCBA